MDAYVHGYGDREAERLEDQARTLEDLLHADTTFPPGSTVLEVGCGTGAQTVALARRSPGARLTAIDVSAASLEAARRRSAAAGLDEIAFERADLRALPHADASVDHVVACFVLEHLADPHAALVELRRVLRPGGTLTVIEGDHGSALFYPDSAAARAAIDCQVELQRRAGGDATIGRALGPTLRSARYDAVRVSPRVVLADAARPDRAESFVLRTFVPMIEGVRDAAIGAGLATAERFDAGLRDLRRTAAADGSFFYAFFKATGRRGV